MPVVSNTSPLLNLAIIDQIHLLRQQFAEVTIPPAVLDELRVGEDLPGAQALGEALAAGWMRVEEVQNRSLVQVLQRDLDRGEAEAIALAVQEKAEWVLLDEREGRRIAKSLGLRVTGLLGVLLRARREGELPSLKAAMENLQTKAGFRIAPQLFDQMLGESGER